MSMFLILLLKSLESLIYEVPFCIILFRWKSINSEAFSVGAPQLDIIGLPETFSKRLCFLRKMQNFSKLVAVLNSRFFKVFKFKVLQSFIWDTLQVL